MPPESRTHRLSARAIAAVSLDPTAAVASVNAYRARKGLGPVRLDPALTRMAQSQAEAMAAGNALSHDLAGAFPTRLEQSGVDTWKAAENLGGGYMSLAEAIAGWRESPAHDRNLLLPEATRLGIAIAKNPETEYGVYWAMEIAAPPSPSAPEGDAMIPAGATPPH